MLPERLCRWRLWQSLYEAIRQALAPCSLTRWLKTPWLSKDPPRRRALHPIAYT